MVIWLDHMRFQSYARWVGKSFQSDATANIPRIIVNLDLCWSATLTSSNINKNMEKKRTSTSTTPEVWTTRWRHILAAHGALAPVLEETSRRFQDVAQHGHQVLKPRLEVQQSFDGPFIDYQFMIQCWEGWMCFKMFGDFQTPLLKKKRTIFFIFVPCFLHNTQTKRFNGLGHAFHPLLSVIQHQCRQRMIHRDAHAVLRKLASCGSSSFFCWKLLENADDSLLVDLTSIKCQMCSGISGDFGHVFRPISRISLAQFSSCHGLAEPMSRTSDRKSL